MNRDTYITMNRLITQIKTENGTLDNLEELAYNIHFEAGLRTLQNVHTDLLTIVGSDEELPEVPDVLSPSIPDTIEELYIRLKTLDNYCNELNDWDLFGSEGQNDPRGDRRDCNYDSIFDVIF